MARNYSLVVNSKFKPFTYDDFMKPILLATQAHRELEDAYSTLSSDTEELEKMLDANRDKMSYATYQNYIKQVNNLADELNQKGLTANSRRSAIKAKDDYHQKIVPIKAGYNRRAEAEKAQQAMLSQDPTRLYARRASELSVDDYVNDQTLDVLSENYSGALLAKQVADQATQYVKWAKKNGQLRNIGLPYIYEQKITSGASPEEVFAAMREDPKALPFLQKVVNNVMESSGIANWTGINGDINNRIYQEALGYAKQGLPAFIGTNVWKDYTDQYNMQLALLKQKQKQSGPGVPPWYKGSPINPNPLYSTDGLSNIRQWANNGFFEKGKDGKYHITAKGIGNLVSSEPVTTGGAGGAHAAAANAQYAKSSDFADFISRTQGKDIRGLKKEEIDALLNDALNDYKDFADADAYREVKFDHLLNNSAKEAIINAIAPQSLSEATYKGKGKYEYASAKKGKDAGINWKEWEPFNIASSRNADILQVRNKETNEVREYQMPTINTIMQNNMRQGYAQVYSLFDAANSDYVPKMENGLPVIDKNGQVVYSDKKQTDAGRMLLLKKGMNLAETIEPMVANLSYNMGMGSNEGKFTSVPVTQPDEEYLPYMYQAFGQNNTTGSYYDNTDYSDYLNVE